MLIKVSVRRRLWKPRADPGSAGRRGRTTARKDMALVWGDIPAPPRLARGLWAGAFLFWDLGVTGVDHHLFLPGVGGMVRTRCKERLCAPYANVRVVMLF